MKAVDTNVVVRLLTNDDPEQTAAAKAFFENGPIWIGQTVLLETSWVLRSLYGFEGKNICLALRGLLGLSNVRTENERAVAAASALGLQGVDFADALHLCGRPPGTEFVTFDQAFVRRAKRAGEAAISLLSSTPNR